MDDESSRRSSRGPSLVDDLMSRTRRFLAGMIADYVKRSIEDLLRCILGRALRYAVSAALFILAAAFLLFGGAEGLVASGMPPYLAHLAIGATALVAGLVALKCCAQESGRK